MPSTPRSTGFSFGVSGLVHGCILSWVVLGPAPEAVETRTNEELVRTYENRIIWYHLKDKLPDAAPGTKRATELRASVKAPHTVVSGPRDEPRVTQLIWLPEAELAAPKPVPLPNVVAVAPKVPRPFTPPPAAAAPKPKLTEAPEAAMPRAKQLALRRPWTPPVEPVRKTSVTLPDAPDAAMASPKDALPEVGKQQRLNRQWTPPASEPVHQAKLTLPDAPD